MAAVARREGWTDLSSPPEAHGPRTLDEEAAVGRFAASLPRRDRRPPPLTRARARLVLVALAVAVLGVCWWVSPERTALALIVAGMVCLVAARRGRRGAGGRRAPRRLGILGPPR